MSNRTNDPIGDSADKDTRDPIGDLADRNMRDPIGDLADKDTRDPLGDFAKDTRDPLGDFAKDTRDPIGDLSQEDTRDPIGDVANEAPNEPVGYGKPPRQYTWKKGQSANPKGRKKGSKNESTILRELLNRKIKIREGKNVRTVTVLEGMLLNFVEDSLKTKNTKSAAFLLNRYGALVSGEAQPNEITEDDREVLKAFAKRAAAERETKDET
jgi:hypothetical protein